MNKKLVLLPTILLLISQLVLPITSVSELQIQNVHAAESSNIESLIDEWMPDKNLQLIIANKLGTTDFSQDDMLSIEDLSIDNLEITDLSGLSYAKNLKVLSITNTDLSATKNLADIAKIETLTDFIATNDNLSNISVFNSTEMPSLTNLDLSYNSFTSLDSFKGINLPVLNKVNISNNKFENVDAYDSVNIPKLEDIDASHNNISDISPLLTSSQASSIKTIDASFNNFQSLNSVTGINLPNLESLDMSNNVLSDISILQTAKVPKLTFLKASYNKIADITPIANSSITSLNELIVDHNQIKDIDAFKTSSFTNLENLDVSYNQIEDISIMENLNDRYPKLSTYKVDNNKISNLKFMNGYSLKDNTSARSQSFNENITLIRPTSGLKSIDMPVITSNFIYNSSTGLYLGTPDPEGNTLTISNVKNVVSMTKFDGTTISFADGNTKSGTGIKTFEVDSSSLPETITFDWTGAHGAFSGSGIININWIDAIAPTIEAHDKTIEQGTFFDPLKDISAFDQQNDGSERKDLTSDIKVVTNNVDSSKPGKYKVEYVVTNNLNISTTKTINIVVKEKEADTVKVTFNTGKGGTLKGNTTVRMPKGTKVTDLPQTVANKSNVEDIYFLDWYQNGKVVNPKNVTITQDTTFTAKFGAAVYRLYNANNGDHLLTKNKNEKNKVAAAGWKVETTPKKEYGRAAFYVPVQEDSAGKKQVYRIYNPNSGEHFYTTNKAEADYAVKKGWKHETNKDYTWVSEGDVKVYREFNPNNRTAGSHNFTTDLQEHKNVVKAGWRDETKSSSLWTVLKAGF